MFNINGWELIVIAVLVLMVFGPERLPEFLFRAGQLLRQFRQMTDEATSEITREFRAAADLAEAELRRPLEETLAAAKEPFTDLTKPQTVPAAKAGEAAGSGAAESIGTASDAVADAEAAEPASELPDDLPRIAPAGLYPPLHDGPDDTLTAPAGDDLAGSDDDPPGATNAT